MPLFSEEVDNDEVVIMFGSTADILLAAHKLIYDFMAVSIVGRSEVRDLAKASAGCMDDIADAAERAFAWKSEISILHLIVAVAFIYCIKINDVATKCESGERRSAK